MVKGKELSSHTFFDYLISHPMQTHQHTPTINKNANFKHIHPMEDMQFIAKLKKENNEMLKGVKQASERGAVQRSSLALYLWDL